MIVLEDVLNEWVDEECEHDAKNEKTVWMNV